MKKMRVAFGLVTIYVLALIGAPGGLAQVTAPPPLQWTVVAANNPSPSYSNLILGLCTPQAPAANTNLPLVQIVICAQPFSIGSSGAYVNQVDLALLESNYNTSTPLTCLFTLMITDGIFEKTVVPYADPFFFGTVFLRRNESLVVPPQSSGRIPTTFTDEFPAVWLPTGNYYLAMIQNDGTNSACSALVPNTTVGAAYIDWSLNASTPPTTIVGNVTPAFVETAYEFGDFLVENAIKNLGLDFIPYFAFDLQGPFFLPPTGGGTLQISRLVVEGPVTPPPGGPVQAQIGFANAATGNLLAPLTPVTLTPGQIQSVDLNLTPFVSRPGQRIEVQPVIAQLPNAAGEANPGPTQISATVQILDALTGFGTVLAPAPQPGSAPGLGPQILAAGQTMRVDLVAAGPDPCVAQVGFNDRNGNPLAPNSPVNLASGAGTSVDLNSATLGIQFGHNIEVQPVVTVSAPATAAPLNSVCNVSVEVFDHLTGRTWTHQGTTLGLPAVQSPAAGTP